MIELQIESSVLKAIVALTVQSRLRTTCFPLLSSLYVDHADVATSPVKLIPANPAIDILIPLDVFLVSRQEILAAPNGIPNGSVAPANRIVLTLQLAITGTVLSLRCIKADLGPLGGTLGPAAAGVETLICSTIGSPLNLNLSSALTTLGLPAPITSQVELADNVVAIRFNTIGNGVGHLFPGQDWGLFIDGQAIEQYAVSQIPPAVRSIVHTVTPNWRPVGTVPQVDIDYAGQYPFPDPIPGDATFDGVISSEFSMTPIGTSSLRSTIHWSVNIHLDLGNFIPGFIENVIEDKLENVIGSVINPESFGAIPIGDHAFAIDRPLPPVSFGGAQLLYGSVLASPEGMTIGGPVRLPGDPGKELLTTFVSPLGLPFVLENCRKLAKAGSGDPRRNLTLDMMTTNGGVDGKGCGIFCGIEILSPNKWLTNYFNKPIPGTIGEDQQISISIKSSAALFISSPVRFILQTARGVRLIDLGVPPAVQIDANGYVINPRYYWLKNCLYIDRTSAYGLLLGHEKVDVSMFVPPPKEDPNWMAYLGKQIAFSIQLVTLTALEPGELIQYRSKDHNIDVTADHNGQTLVPVLLSATNQEPASLIRVNRQGIAGHVSVSTALFSHQATFPAGMQHRLSSIFEGTVELITKFDNHIEIHEIGPLGVTKLRSSHAEVELDPQPLPPAEIHMREQIALLKEKINLRGIISLIAVPGFADAPISIASMADGSKLVLDFAESGKPRVAGTFTGPIGVLEVQNDWALASGSDRVSIYRVTRT